MQIDGRLRSSIVVVAVLVCLVASITLANLTPNQIIQNVFAINSTITSTSSPNTNLGNITLGNPQFNYTGYDKTTSFRPATVNGTHGIQVSFAGHGIVNGIDITDNGSAFVTNGTGGVVYIEGDGKLVSKNGTGTLSYAFQGTGHYGADGKLRATGSIFQHHYPEGKVPIELRTTGNLAFLKDTSTIYKNEVDKAGNAVLKIWFWR